MDFYHVNRKIDDSTTWQIFVQPSPLLCRKPIRDDTNMHFLVFRHPIARRQNQFFTGFVMSSAKSNLVHPFSNEVFARRTFLMRYCSSSVLPLDPRHIAIRQSEMMADLMHQNMAHQILQ